VCAQLGRARWRIESGLRVEVVQELCAVDPELGWLVDVAKYGVPVGYVGVFPTGRVRPSTAHATPQDPAWLISSAGSQHKDILVP